MNYEKLRALIERYEKFFDNPERDENFKWRAFKVFRDVWYSEQTREEPLALRFKQATKECSVMINNSHSHPANGIVKLAEAEPERMNELFFGLLLGETSSAEELQNRMDLFIEGTEEIRLAHFPKCYYYKQERHAVSCYLSMLDPDKHYIYRYTDAEFFVDFTEYGKDLGSGQTFSLANYYELCDIVVEELKKYPELMKKHYGKFADNEYYYEDANLHLMAFDLMYTARYYKLYNAHYKAAEQKYAQELADEIREYELQLEEYKELSLLNVEVTQKDYGTGRIVDHTERNITVQFADRTVKYVIKKEYTMRPRFDHDDMILSMLDEMDAIRQKKKGAEDKLRKLEAAADK